jgi:hypothetical protein
VKARLASGKFRFARDSALEGEGFELSVPRVMDVDLVFSHLMGLRAPEVAGDPAQFSGKAKTAHGDAMPRSA